MQAQNAALVEQMTEEERKREREELIQKYGAGLLDRVQKAKAARGGVATEGLAANGMTIMTSANIAHSF